MSFTIEITPSDFEDIYILYFSRLKYKENGRHLAQFLRTGNPNCQGMPEWKPYNPKDGWTMMLNDECKLVKDLDKEARKAF